MSRIALPTLLALLCLPAQAVDVTLLGGYQWNRDFSVATDITDPPDNVELGEPGDDVELEDDLAIGLAVDFVYKDNPNQRLGFMISHHQTEFDSNAGLIDPDIDITHVHFTGMSYYPYGRWEPFAMAGIGAAFFSPSDSSLRDDTLVSFQIAGGTNFQLTDSLLLRADARWIGSFFDSSAAGICGSGCTIAVKSQFYSQVQVNLGLQFRF